MSKKVLMKGNEAFAEAAIRGGCRYYFGYPITPQNEIPEYMSRELPKHGGHFIQAESEIGAINMAYGAAASGGRVFITSSSPGIALMQEGLSFLCCAELPTVVLTVSRGGPGIGTIQPGQADYFQATRGGGNGDYMIPVLAPSSVQEGADMVYEAMELSDKWRNPVFIFTDGLLGQMMEPVELPDPVPEIKREDIKKHKPWAMTGYGDDDSKKVSVRALRLESSELEAHVQMLFKRYAESEKDFLRVETMNIEDADVVICAYGIVARIAKEAIELLGQQNLKVGLIRPISIRPFPYATFENISDKTKVVISAELSMGQMIEDVKLAVGNRFPIRLLNRTGGMVPTPIEIAERTKKIFEEMC